MLKVIVATLTALVLVMDGARAAGVDEFSCVIPFPDARSERSGDIGPEIPGVGALFREQETGWSLARIDARGIGFEKVPSNDTGLLLEALSWPGVGTLFLTDRWSLVRNHDGKIAIEPVELPAPHDHWPEIELQSAGSVRVLVNASAFALRDEVGKIVIDRLGPAAVTRENARSNLSGGTLFLTDARPHRLLFEAQEGETRQLIDSRKLGDVEDIADWTDNGVLIAAAEGVFLAVVAQGRLDIQPIGPASPNGIRALWELDSANALLHDDDRRLYHLRRNEAHVRISVLADGEAADQLFGREWPGVGALLSDGDNLSLARMRNGQLEGTTIEMPSIVRPEHLLEVYDAGALVFTEKGWGLVSWANDRLSFQQLANPEVGRVHNIWWYQQGSILMLTDAGWFSMHQGDGWARIEPLSKPLSKFIDDGPFGGSGRAEVMYAEPLLSLPVSLLSTSEYGSYIVAHASLADAQVDILRRDEIDRSTTETRFERNVMLTVKHLCARALHAIDVRARITSPREQESLLEPLRIDYRDGRAEIALLQKIDAPGKWRIQLVSVIGGKERAIGEPQTLSFVAPADWRTFLETWGWWLGSAVTGFFVLANAAVFIAARRSAWAWRVATSAALGTWPYRILTSLLSHISSAQLWILDLYFQHRKASLGARPAFVPLPVSGEGGATRSADDLLMPPWTGRRLWIQGNSGMGKSALVQSLAATYFGEPPTVFEAYATWRCVIAVVEARDYAFGEDDKPDASWVVNAVRGTLSQSELTFESDELLHRLLRSGTVAIVIDGLHEAGRTRSVEEFARSYPAAPLIVTSQEVGPKLFTTWRLPPDIRAFIDDLLRVYLGAEAGAAVSRRIEASGLRESIRSGYDVRLIVDMSRHDPLHAPLPANRIELYEAVLVAGWPAGTEEAMHEQQDRTAAAAWRMVSEREPHQDRRRLKPDDDLSSDLLVALADAPDRERRPVRLLRRSGDLYEFVHDQMHAYLAARWFTQYGRSSVELETMLRTSKIWQQTIAERRMVCGFIAAMLDDTRLVELLEKVEDVEAWDVLRRELNAQALQRTRRGQG